MNHARLLVSCALVFCLVAAPAIAHEITFKGTVVSVESAKSLKVTVTVVDEKTKKPKPMVFEIDDETKILRGTVAVKLADAHIQKGESISVTVDHELSETLAAVVKLPVRK
jgi:hypothetical protein